VITTVEAALHIPYVLVVESVEAPTGEWTRRVSYPDLRSCSVEAVNLAEAIDALERMKVSILVAMVRSGEAVPVPKAPLKDRTVLLSSDAVESVLAAAEAQAQATGVDG
jgi:hypothetical protein